ncbi:MAG: protease modulator HflC, partial [Burkholderiales bacterium]|nr:protease modulator HflC [Burkholderiales bacterium]
MNKLISTLLAVLIAGVALYSTIFVVDQRSHAIVFALGEVKAVISEPGLHFKLPPP